MPARRGLVFLALEASLARGGETILRRELLRIEPSRRRMLLAAGEVRGSITLDVSDTSILATLTGSDEASVEVDCIAEGPAPSEIEIWAVCPSSRSVVELLDNFGRAVVPDLCARDPSMPALTLAPGRYLLRASTTGGPCIVRMASEL
ncbi:MAG: hypothetical protein RI967_2301 [Planctomycetota bacterium]|jgi:hypothetical protein